MFEWIQLLPWYLIVLTILLAILPTIISSFVRITLYSHLKNASQKVKGLLTNSQRNRGDQPSIVRNLENRFRNASIQLEKVNTPALIDGLYGEEKFTFFWVSLQCESSEYFTKVLPNLLLAFGLLGTFLGITLNLADISNIISSNPENTTKGAINIGELKGPLQSMGIAFITSLIGLLCSSILTVINLQFNTGLMKNNLLIALEDYLDNIFHPTIEGNTRLDKAVNRMVDQQQEFLLRFHEKVGQVMESTLGAVANRMAEENEQSNRIARQVYERFMDASGTISAAASTFQGAALSIEKQVETMGRLMSSFETSSHQIEKSVTVFKAASDKIEQSKFSENLENLTASLAITQKDFSTSTSLLADNVQEIIEGNKKANNLAAQVYVQLQKSSRSLQDSAIGFIEAAEKIERSQFADKLSTASAELATSHNQFAQSTSLLQESTQVIASTIQGLHTSIEKMDSLGEQVSGLNKRSTQLLELNQQQLKAEREDMKNIQSELGRLIDRVKESQEQAKVEVQTLGNILTNSISQQIGTNSKELQKISQVLRENVTGFQATNVQITTLINTLKEYQQQGNNQVYTLGKIITSNIHEQLEDNSNKLQTVAQAIQQSATNLKDTRAELSRLFNSVDTKNTEISNNLKSWNSSNNSSSQQQLQIMSKLLESSLYQTNHLDHIKSDVSRLLTTTQNSKR